MENNQEKPIPSPYIHTVSAPSKEDEKFLMAINAVCILHGHRDYFFAFSQKTKPDEEQWKAFSTALNKSMLHALIHIIKGMQEALNKLK